MNEAAVKAALAVRDALAALYSAMGDPRAKNAAILILALLSAFGILAPETATALRNAVLAMAL